MEGVSGVWASFCGSYYDYKMHLSNSHQGTLKKQDLLLTSPGEYMAHPGLYRVVVGREREKEREIERKRKSQR